MRKIVFIIVLLSFVIQVKSQPTDLRNVETGSLIYKNSYIDQPYMLQLKDGSWFCVFTTGAESESRPGQHIVAMRSYDKGKTWTQPVKIEPNEGPISSWAIPYITTYGRIYVFYNYNGDNISTVRGKTIRQAGLLGWYCYKYSDDLGATWSAERYRVPIRKTAADVFNEFDGLVQMFWSIDKPHYKDGNVFFTFSKLGKYVQDMGEGWLLMSENLDTERNPSNIKWKMLPDGEYGMRNPIFQSVQEEHNTTLLSDGSIYCVFRTALGFLGYSISRDNGKSWSKPDTLRYAASLPNVIKNPRACPRLFKCKNGNFLLWYHNHGGKDFKERSPVWMCGGIERNGVIEWSQPEILLYTHNTKVGGMSYPDLMEENGKFWISETQKHIGRTHIVDPKLLEGMWNQNSSKSLIKDGLVVNKKKIQKPTTFAMPSLGKINDGGMTIEIQFTLKSGDENQILFDSKDENGKGVYIATQAHKALYIEISDGKNPPYTWKTDENIFTPGEKETLSLVVDGLAQVVTIIKNGRLQDGGENQKYGWGKYSTTLGDVTNKTKAKLLSKCTGELHTVRIYNRYLTTSECISNYNSNIK